MYGGEVSVNYLCETLGESQPKVSRHLAYLRSMGVVNTRRDGKWIYYSLCEPENKFGSRLLSDTISWISSIRQDDSIPGKPQLTANVKSNEIVTRAHTYGKVDMSRDSEELEVYLL